MNQKYYVVHLKTVVVNTALHNGHDVEVKELNNTISVGMTTYNSSRFIGEQIESILAQTVLPDEIVICDDASSDNTVEILHKILDKNEQIRVRIIQNEKNIGYIKNFEKCFSLCTGDIIISCDADDIWFPDKIEKTQRVFRNNDVVYCYHDAIVINENKEILNESLNASWDFLDGSVDSEKVLLRNVKRQGFPYGMTIAFRRSLLMEILPFRFAHDGWINMCAPLFGKIVYIDEPLAYYRRHGNNTSGTNGEGILQRIKQIEKQPWFDWPRAYIASYEEYYNKFKALLPKSVKTELERQINFRYQLAEAIEENVKWKSVSKLLKCYGGYKKYRGNWKSLLVDCYFIITK